MRAADFLIFSVRAVDYLIFVAHAADYLIFAVHAANAPELFRWYVVIFTV